MFLKRAPKQTSGPQKIASNLSWQICRNVSMAALLCTQKRLGPCWVRLGPCWVRLGPCWVMFARSKKAPQMGPKAKFWIPKNASNFSWQTCENVSMPKLLCTQTAAPQKGSSFLDPGPPKNTSNSSKPTCQNVSMAALLCTQKAPPQRALLSAPWTLKECIELI